MRMNYTIVVASLAGLLAASCAKNESQATSQSLSQTTDIMIVDSVSDSGIRTAIITQHTLYAYHFVDGGTELNDLGKRDLAVLMSHFKAHDGGSLSIRCGETPQPLYAARVQAVQDLLKAGGIDPAKVQIADASPGGAGMSGNDAARAMSKSDEAFQSSSGGTGGSGGGGSSSGSSSSGGPSAAPTPGAGQ